MLVQQTVQPSPLLMSSLDRPNDPRLCSYRDNVLHVYLTVERCHD